MTSTRLLISLLLLQPALVISKAGTRVPAPGSLAGDLGLPIPHVLPYDPLTAVGPFNTIYLLPYTGPPTSKPFPTWGSGPTNRPEDVGISADSDPTPEEQSLSPGIGIPCPGCGNLLG